MKIRSKNSKLQRKKNNQKILRLTWWKYRFISLPYYENNSMWALVVILGYDILPVVTDFYRWLLFLLPVGTGGYRWVLVGSGGYCFFCRWVPVVTDGDGLVPVGTGGYHCLSVGNGGYWWWIVSCPISLYNSPKNISYLHWKFIISVISYSNWKIHSEILVWKVQIGVLWKVNFRKAIS